MFRYCNAPCWVVVLLWIIVGQGPTVLAVGAGGECWIFFSLGLSCLFFFSLSLVDCLM